MDIQLAIPDGTRMEEKTVVLESDLIVGSGVDFGYGVIANNIRAGERVSFGGTLDARGDVEIDGFSSVSGDLVARGNVYLGEGVRIGGRLVVDGDLDIGREIKIEEGFEAHGWIRIRNPLPFVLYIYLYLLALLQLGRAEQVEEALNELFSEEAPDPTQVMVVPPRSMLDFNTIQTPAPVVVGRGCRLVGNIRAKSVEMGEQNELFGGIRARTSVVLGKDNVIHGGIEARHVRVEQGCRILGRVKAHTLEVHPSIDVESLVASESMVFIRDVEELREGNAALDRGEG
ncbi:polymer-forming cytoskeletal protein [Methermicoccus shengliensis]|uniref:Acyltransferase n=1 Tax=Methermicoccus shengliensis TaxID=660064 RepID=A0A832RVK8_9EURY|nr:polymer-forming cytoskeletal protein [Methermicoccus shengliensis]KUK04306.1 MAG: hypothetical protein XD46_0961 [Euryarchaeota archaeon 55_53]KUK30649.1 MAG: hypothetical protein XD62_0351 [Methanosarcinales archeaon 56_1174]MDI3488198.1 hypothetical protein [Methanosarcinales archaeon]MDN5295473.1 hypothetical protein [Methanosarcinales archaeon]HIH70237.1 acyltransferase [Methermicoccus shengliensis]